jgi:multisubunit Na+/H+ antiporter MnhE subunit
MNTLKLFGLYLFIWLILSGAKIELFVVLFLLLLSFLTPYLFTLQYKQISIRATLRLLFWFVVYSFWGGVQVALFALRPKLKLNPFIYHHPLKAHNALSLSLLANIYSLMPGTLSIGHDENVLSLHILDKTLFDKTSIERFESYVLEAFAHKEEA